MSAHEEMLAAAKNIVKEKGINEFYTRNIIDELRLSGSTYAPNTINAEMLRCCINCPRDNETPHDYFERIGRGKYRLISTIQ
ncbi:MAG: hypothetical protein ABFC38_04260 [Methanospirillum sp.]